MPLTDQTTQTPDRARMTAADSALAVEAIARVHLASDAPHLLERLMTATAALGATASIYSLSIPEKGPEPSSFSLFACHPRLAEQQMRLGPLRCHPWFRFAAEHPNLATDQQIVASHPADTEAIELTRRYGFTSCLVIPTAPGSLPERSEVLCLGSTAQDAFEGEDSRILRTLARTLAMELHDWVHQHLWASLQEAAGLQSLDIELLRLEAEGIGTKEISLRTGMSADSIDSRFKRLNARLECKGRKAAARRAAAYGLLEQT